MPYTVTMCNRGVNMTVHVLHCTLLLQLSCGDILKFDWCCAMQLNEMVWFHESSPTFSPPISSSRARLTLYQLCPTALDSAAQSSYIVESVVSIRRNTSAAASGAQLLPCGPMHVSGAKRYQICNNDWCHCKTKFRRVPLVGASLSEPHTCVTSLHPCVCMFACLLAWTDHLP